MSDDHEVINIFSKGGPPDAKKKWMLQEEILQLALELYGGTDGDSLQRLQTAWTHLRRLKHPSPVKHAPGSKEDREARAAAKTAEDLMDDDAIEEHRKQAWVTYFFDNYSDENWARYQAIDKGEEEPPDEWPEGVDPRVYITTSNLNDALSGFEPSGDETDDESEQPEPEAPQSEMHKMLAVASANADAMRRKREPADAA